jgi:restriction endonuclease S subunit
MITYSIIQKSQLEGALRLDAEYYQPEYLTLNSKLKSQKSKFLGEIGEVAYGTTPPGGIFEKEGIPFVRSQNFSNILINISDLVFCTKEFHQQNKKSAIRPGDVLFAAVGATIGEVAIVQDEIQEGNINQNIARVRITDKKINPYFAGIFFASRPGQLQIERLITGNAQPYLNSEQIKALIVPFLGEETQKEIESYFQEIQNQIKISQNFYSQSENLLLEELGLKDFKVEDDLSYVVNLSDVKSAHRADAEYFQPKYEKLISKIKSQNAKLLGEIVSMKKGIEPGAEAYEDEGKLFIRVSSLSKYGIEDKDQKYLSEELYQKLRNNYEPKVGEILLTKDATPGIAYVAKEQIEGIISSGILRLKIKDKEIENEYLALCLNSVVGQMQAERDGGGSIITHWKPDQIKKVLVPLLPRPTQQKIADLVQKSHAARSKAKQLLAEAKSKIERFIEKSL